MIFSIVKTKTEVKDAQFFDWKNVFGITDDFAFLMAEIVLIIYGVCLLLILFYSILQLILAFKYRASKSRDLDPNKPQKLKFNQEKAPYVTIQIPIYNEFYVAERIIDKVAQIDYPSDRLEIQVLDDSTDETKDVVAKKIAGILKHEELDIKHIHRNNRVGFKAGALADALPDAKGEFIAIFDVDFLPNPDFLKQTIPYFNDENIGVVQTRWGHINKDYSLLTELQAFGLNGHFAIEQGGRNSAGHYINFNGTGGVWRKTCITDAGGWEHDTLTEDLDLSYRAQLKGWKFKYLENVVAPAELPITMSALKGQQHRWMKGGAECFRKMFKQILTTKNIRWVDRVHGLAHLFNSSVFVFILLMSLLSIPILYIKDTYASLNYFIQFGSVFILATVFLMFYYWNAFQDKMKEKGKSFGLFVWRFLQFLTVSMGLSLNNAVAVIEGYLGIKSSFVRTPKFNVSVNKGKVENKYDKKSISLLTVGEGILFLVFGFTTVNRLIHGDLGMVPFHLMLTIGYGTVFFYTLFEVKPKWLKIVPAKTSNVNV